MFTTLLECERAENGNIRTPRGRLCYVTPPSGGLLKPITYVSPEGATKLKYSCSFAFPKNANIEVLREEVREAATKRFGADFMKKFPRFKMPFLNTAEYPKMGLDPEEFPVFIRVTKDPEWGGVNVVDHKRNPVTDPAQVYSGRWALLSVSAFAYPKKEGKDHGNRGVSFGLSSAMLLEHGERLAGGGASAEQDFKPVEIAESADSFFA
jgi:hypothetical protein